MLSFTESAEFNGCGIPWSSWMLMYRRLVLAQPSLHGYDRIGKTLDGQRLRCCTRPPRLPQDLPSDPRGFKQT